MTLSTLNDGEKKMEKRKSLDVVETSVAVEAEVVDIEVAEIIELHNEAGELQSKAFGYAKMTIKNAIRVGELLTKRKTALEHGQWLPWIKDCLPFGQKTAWTYVNCYKNRDKLVLVTNLREAYLLLEAPKKDKSSKKKAPWPEPAEASRAFLDERAAMRKDREKALSNAEKADEEPEARDDDQAEATSHEPEAGHQENPSQDTEDPESTTGEAEDGEPEFAESGKAPIEVKGGNGGSGEEVLSIKEVLVSVLRDVSHDLESILLDCDSFTETHGEIDGSIFRQFTEEELAEVSQLVKYFALVEKKMAVIKQLTAGKKGKREGFFSRMV